MGNRSKEFLAAALLLISSFPIGSHADENYFKRPASHVSRILKPLSSITDNKPQSIGVASRARIDENPDGPRASGGGGGGFGGNHGNTHLGKNYRSVRRRSWIRNSNRMRGWGFDSNGNYGYSHRRVVAGGGVKSGGRGGRRVGGGGRGGGRGKG